MNKVKNNGERAMFGSRFAAIATTVGSAVGLGNVWRFPYEAGMHGGGAFLMCYFVCAFMIGVPVLIAEFVMGRSSRSGVIRSYGMLSSSPRWKLAGYVAAVASVLITGFYSVVAGWTFEYFIESMFGMMDFSSAESTHEQFSRMTTGWESVLWTVLFSLCNCIVIARGVTKGIEKVSNILMPLLFVILIVFCVHSCFLPGFGEGMSFLFQPDFSAIDSSTMLSALGQAFFSLSLGMGTMITYASFFTEQTPLGKTAVTTMVLDTMVAIMCGIIIFPAVFSYGFSPEAGPTLVFEVLPNLFYRMPWGGLWSTLFFLFLFVAALTSTISITEIFTTALTDGGKRSRRRATLIACGTGTAIGILCALSLGPCRALAVGGMSLFDFLDFTASNILLPLGGMLGSIFVGWFIERRYIKRELTDDGTHGCRWLKAWVFMLRWICPLAILLIFLDTLGLI